MAKLRSNCINSNTGKALNSTSLDTLAQLATFDQEDPNFKLSKGTDINDKKTLQKRARRKYMSSSLSTRLVDASKQNPDSLLQKSYWNSYHCCKQLGVMESGKVISSYCKNRWCLVCNSIRTAQLILRYKPVLDKWENKTFVTLTRGPRVTSVTLKAAIEEMQFIFNQIRKIFGKRAQRGTGKKFLGLRKLECTYDPTTNTYHPHYHLILDCPEMAEEFVNIWLKKNPLANRKAQDIRPADNNSVLEIFKYFTKVISKTKSGDKAIYADAMDVIFNCIKGKRTFQNFGFKVGKVDFSKEEIAEITDQLAEVATWEQDVSDWVVKETGELISGYAAGEGMRDLVENKIVVRTGFNSS